MVLRDSIRILFGIVALNDLQISSMDNHRAYLFAKQNSSRNQKRKPTSLLEMNSVHIIKTDLGSSRFVWVKVISGNPFPSGLPITFDGTPP